MENEWSDDELYNSQFLDTTSANTPEEVRVHPSEDPDDLTVALEKSRALSSLQEKVTKIHSARLDNLLTANGLQRVPVPPDGNCFFYAAALQLEVDHSVLRQQICDNMVDCLPDYLPFFSSSDSNDCYIEGVNAIDVLRKEGAWDSMAGDIVPLALANVTGRPVKIFTSKRLQPIIDIRPPQTLTERAVPIFLALLAPSQISPHYDSCFRTHSHLSNIRGHPPSSFPPPPSQADPEMSPTATPQPEMSPTATPQPEMSPTAQPDPEMSPTATPQPEMSPTAQPDPEMSPTAQPDPEMSPTATPYPEMSPTATPYPEISSTATPDPEISPTATPDPEMSPTATPDPEMSPTATPDPEMSTPTKSVPSPRKSAVYVTPPKKKLTRKKVSDHNKWKSSIRKRDKRRGLEYIQSTGKKAPAKCIQPVNCKGCRTKCSENVSEEKREQIFNQFYSLESYERQKDFVCQHVSETQTRTYLLASGEPVNKKRHVVRKYFFNVDNERKYVCKTFFKKTLDVGDAYIDHALRHSDHGSFIGSERRGRHAPVNKTPQEQIARVKEHIESFPALDSHYCRQTSKRKYLDSNLSIKRMHELYTIQCQKAKEQPVKEDIYRRTFNTEYNLGFHRPKKDQCSQCSMYRDKKDKGTVNDEEEKDYNEHRNKITRAREEKERDKYNAKNDSAVHVATFDLQAVLPTPCSLVSQMYYKRKLGVYNLSFYSLGDGRATCYMWNESEGKKGACEIGTCLLLYMRSLPACVNDVVLYSDCCGGQNRNMFVAAALLYAVENTRLQSIDQKFLISGHTQMESDTIHQRIEKAKQCTAIHIPSQWDTVVNMARKSDPFTVVPVRHTDIIDFKTYTTSKIRNAKVDLRGNRVNWLNIRWLRYTKAEPDILYFKYDFDESFRIIKVSGTSSRRGRQSDPAEITNLYQAKLPISAAKKKDLLELCRIGIIPEECHSFYQGLPSSLTTSDRLLEPDMEEEDGDDSD